MKKYVGLVAVFAVAIGQDVEAQEAVALEPVIIETLGGVPMTGTVGNLPKDYPGGQRARGGRMGLLGNRDFMDTPFSTTSFTQEAIEDKGARTVADVVADDSSVRNTHSSGGMLDSFYVRGFPLNEGNFGEIAFDGVFGVAPTYRLFADYAERIEVVKGPTALLYGISPNSSVGGTINIVPKRAGDVDLTRLSAHYANDLQGGGHVDVSRRFGSERQFGVRFNGSYHGGDTPLDNQSRDALVGALALDYQGERFRATLDIIGQHEEVDAPQRPYFPVAGIAIPAAPSGRSNIQQPWEWSKATDGSALARVEYDLTDAVTLFAAVGGGNSHVERLFGTPTLLNTAGDVSVTPQNAVFDVDRLTAEAGLRARFDTAAVTHMVTFQASGLHQNLDRAINSGTAQPTNIYDPVLRPAQNVPVPSIVPRVSENEFYGVALADTVSIFGDRLHLTVGGRWQHIESRNFGPAGAVASSSDEGALTPLVGFVVKPWENVSLYANYIQGLSVGDTAPGVAVNAGETLPPYRSEQFEVGTKIDFWRVALTVAAFQITRPFGQLEGQGSDLVFVEGGEQRNRGLELSLFGEVAPSLRLLGGVTLLDGKLTATNSQATLGNRPIGVPTVQFNLGGEWDTPFLAGLTLAANVAYTGKQFVDTANLQELPAWTRLDLGARYKTVIEDRPVTFRLAVENVLDADYWAGVASFGTISQGAPLTVKLSLTTDF
jgi:iron complex outermembrane receptor protein